MFRVNLISAFGAKRFSNVYAFASEVEAHSFALLSFFKLRNVVAAEIVDCSA